MITKDMRWDVKESLDEYAKNGRPTGGFLEAFLANDLMGAVGRADGDNIQCFREIARYIYNDMPAGCHGSYQKIHDWTNRFDKEGTNGKA